jgi:hypothetical protein
MPRIVVAVAAVLVLMAASSASPSAGLAWRSLDGRWNNLRHPGWGQAGSPYLRLARPNYADGVDRMVAGPPARYVSNRVFNDVGQNLFSENGVSQWGWVWGQFLDHDFGLRDETPGESAPIAFDRNEPLEQFASDLRAIGFARTPAARGTGETEPRQQINTLSSYIDGSNLYGVSSARLEWLRTGRVDGDLSNNGPALLLTADGYLPRAGARGSVKAAPVMDLFGAQIGNPGRAVVAGDVRANENVALTSIHTLFAREHNRIVAALPRSLPASVRFELARRVVGAEIQWITFTQFLPALGVELHAYRGYDPTVNAGLANEFAVVGYRAHSMIHGEFDVTASAESFSARQLRRFRAQGIVVESDDEALEVEVPLGVAFGNPDLLRSIGLGRFLASLGAERQYRNDEQIDNALRSVLFQIPKPGTANPSSCGSPVVSPRCFSGVLDLGAVDIQRGRDHGMPSYNALRSAYGLAPKASFTAVTGEVTPRFPIDRLLNRVRTIDDPDILDFVGLRDAEGEVVPLRSEEAREEAVVGIRRTTLAARLKAIYGSVDRLDAFVGMVAERHVPGTEFGELQLAIWSEQFEALRNGDRFFFLNDPLLPAIRARFGIDYRRTLASVIRANTAARVQDDVFRAAVEERDETAPAVSLKAAVVRGAVVVVARASDDVGVAGVQFTLDGRPLGAEDTSAPYAISWNPTTGRHVLGAVARDAAGNSTRAAELTVLVSTGHRRRP